MYNQLITYHLPVCFLLRIQQYPVNTTYNKFKIDLSATPASTHLLYLQNKARSNSTQIFENCLNQSSRIRNLGLFGFGG